MSTSTAQAASDTLTAATGQAVMLVQMAPPSWVTYVAALLTPTVAILGILIAYRQWRTAQEKLALDLFNRRFSVYEATLAVMTKAVSKEQFMESDLAAFSAAIRGAKFLFDEQVETYLEDLHKKLFGLADVSKHHHHFASAGESNGHSLWGVQVMRQLIAKDRNDKVVDEVFKDFMKLPR